MAFEADVHAQKRECTPFPFFVAFTPAVIYD
jgi:hypothetical protein